MNKCIWKLNQFWARVSDAMDGAETAWKRWPHGCHDCFYEHRMATSEPCESCSELWNSWKWRPQGDQGEGVE